VRVLLKKLSGGGLRNEVPVCTAAAVATLLAGLQHRQEANKDLREMEASRRLDRAACLHNRNHTGKNPSHSASHADGCEPCRSLTDRFTENVTADYVCAVVPADAHCSILSSHSFFTVSLPAIAHLYLKS
jgi:hypothetical protein